jgi:16S rRNA (uracil1498-N3)-methyltransferase
MDYAAFAPRMTDMARFFVPSRNIQDNRGLVTGQELQHLRRVLRLAPGDNITVFDDTGREHDAVIRSYGDDSAAIEIIRSYEAQRESALDLTLAVGLTKGSKMDFTVEKATELGVRAILPFVSAHAVPKLDERKIAARSVRWEKIALSAAKQCRRTQVPKILPLCGFQELLEQARPDALKLFFWEGEPRHSLRRVQEQRQDVKSILMAIGPEGGFSPREAALAEEHGFLPVSLGRRILRAETAVVSAIALAQFIWGDLG